MTNPARILIVDDEAPARRRMRELLDDCREDFALTIVDEAATGFEAMDIVVKGGIDIVLMDIRMPVVDGIEAAQHIAKMPNPPRLIFATAYDEHAVKAFELNAADYLLKPFKAERLLAALRKASPINVLQAQAIADAAENKRKHLSIHERCKVVLVPIQDILYLKSELKYVTVRTANKEYLLEESLTRLEEEFGAVFTRVHRNALVATKAITGFEKVSNGEAEGQWVVMLTGLEERLPVSRRQQHIVRSL